MKKLNLKIKIKIKYKIKIQICFFFQTNIFLYKLISILQIGHYLFYPPKIKSKLLILTYVVAETHSLHNTTWLQGSNIYSGLFSKHIQQQISLFFLFSPIKPIASLLLI